MKTFLEQHLLNLDLHGVRHHEVKIMVEDFVLNNQKQLPLIRPIVLFKAFMISITRLTSTYWTFEGNNAFWDHPFKLDWQAIVGLCLAKRNVNIEDQFITYNLLSNYKHTHTDNVSRHKTIAYWFEEKEQSVDYLVFSLFE